MATTSEIARRYFDALAARDLDAAVQCWRPGAQQRLSSGEALEAPRQLREHLRRLLDALPDLAVEVVDLTTSRQRTAVRWRARGTFAGPGRLDTLAPNGASVRLDGCDVLVVEDDRIVAGDSYLDSGALARQLGLAPAPGSAPHAGLARLANLRTRARGAIHGVQAEPIAPGVWLVRGGFPLRTMNVYLIEDDGGVTVFDAGCRTMAVALRAACARLGGVRRVILGHADADHRGAAPALSAPVLCHPAERPAAESQAWMRDYWDLGRLRPYARPFFARALESWDGGAVEISGTVVEGDRVAGFEVVELPGHAPGQIALFRASDRLALISDCVYTLDIQTGRHGPPRVPHPAFDADVEQARASILKLAGLGPSAAWPGHARAVAGDVSAQLRAAARAAI
ncbi:MAG TPA: nuclear transport factor 2 family protein [Solirubrobacteraceae bacterium]|nr:nuclear transport factor 2 family protein [Solirubrobacteraceae bacterium]